MPQRTGPSQQTQKKAGGEELFGAPWERDPVTSPEAMPTPAPEWPWWQDLLANLGVVTAGGAALGGLGTAFGAPAWLARWVLPALGRIGAAAGYEALVKRELPIVSTGLQAASELLGPAVAGLQRVGPWGRRLAARAHLPEAERRGREALKALEDELARLGEVGQRILRDIGEAGRRVVRWWAEELPAGTEAGRAIWTSPKARDILTRRYGEALAEAVNAVEGTPVSLPARIAQKVAKETLTIDEKGQVMRVPVRTVVGPGRWTDTVAVDAADAVRGLNRLPADERYLVLRQLDRTLGDLPELAALREARDQFREGVRFLDYLWSRTPRAPAKLAGAPRAAEAVEELQRLYGTGPLAVHPKPWERAAAEAQQRARALQTRLERERQALAQQLEELRRGRLHMPTAGPSAWVHVRGLPLGFHVGRFYTSEIPRTRAEWLWAQSAPTAVGPALTTGYQAIAPVRLTPEDEEFLRSLRETRQEGAMEGQ